MKPKAVTREWDKIPMHPDVIDMQQVKWTICRERWYQKRYRQWRRQESIQTAMYNKIRKERNSK